ncbi:MAG: hypothetical protein AMS22_10430 [Thiotrichales bacterium SG8_50]|nr:MAG: hypothetical protein AMS22_10430 [Thiotrichales bacterium SG8_50]
MGNWYWNRAVHDDGEAYYPDVPDSIIGPEYWTFNVTDKEAEDFGLEEGSCIVLWEDRLGFVYTQTSFASLEEAQEWIDRRHAVPVQQ